MSDGIINQPDENFVERLHNLAIAGSEILCEIECSLLVNMEARKQNFELPEGDKGYALMLFCRDLMAIVPEILIGVASMAFFDGSIPEDERAKFFPGDIVATAQGLAYRLDPDENGGEI